jgi:hypothetical protein
MAVLRGGLVLQKEPALGIINGINVTFRSTYPFIAGTLAVYLNGLELSGPEDYTEIDNRTIQFANPPLGGTDSDIVLMTYQRS